MIRQATLHFHSDNTMPGPHDAAHAATWAAQRGHYRIAQQLLGLAAALEALYLERADRHGLGLPVSAMRPIMRVAEPPTERDQPNTFDELPGSAKNDLGSPTRAAADHSGGSRAPASCATCAGVIQYIGPLTDTWRHTDPNDGLDGHEARPA